MNKTPDWAEKDIEICKESNRLFEDGLETEREIR